MSLTFHNLSHSYGQTQVLQDISFTANEGEILCLLGPSGGGKSTLLRLAAGLERLQAGRIDLDGHLLAKPGVEPPPEARPIGLVFQDHVLFPHLTVAENLRFGLQNQSRKERVNSVADLLTRMDLVGLDGRFPHELSGGQQQRVALARALAPAPRVLLLDEPFASVDSTLRRSLRQATRRALRDAGTTAIVVTHDPEEAMQLADAIAVMANGAIAQHGTPEAIWHEPATLDVALLFGDAQALAGTANSGNASSSFGRFPGLANNCPDGLITIAVRPQGVALTPASATQTPNAIVQDVRLLGHHWQVQLHAIDNADEQLIAAVDGLNGISVGTQLCAELRPADCFVFSNS